MSALQSQRSTQFSSRGAGGLSRRIRCGRHWRQPGFLRVARWLGVFLVGPAVGQTNPIHAGFGFDRSPLTLESGFRTEAGGPFFYEHRGELAHTWALPPLFSYTDWVDGHATEYDFAYPLLTYDRFGEEYRWQLFQLLNFSGGQTQADAARHRFTLFPLYFQQRSPDTNQNYTALFPFYGHLKNRLFRSEIDFALWPLYVKTVKRRALTGSDQVLSPAPDISWLQPRQGEVTTFNFLCPFFHLRYGDALFGWQFWPWFGTEHQSISLLTNDWGEVEQIPGHDKQFFLWPFYEHQHRDIGTTNPATELLCFPFYHRLRSPQRDSTSYLTPFGLTLTEDRAREYHEVDCPWPLIVFAWGEGKTTRRVWPLFSRARTRALESNFYLWPAYTYKRTAEADLDRRRTRSFFFLFSHTHEANRGTGRARTRTDLWPWFTHQRDFQGRTRLQLLAPLEPILPASKSIERNYSPLWSLWRAETNPETGASSQSFLWNLFRREVVPAPVFAAPAPPPPPPAGSGNFLSALAGLSATGAAPGGPELPPVTPFAPPTKKISLLFGLFQYESTGANRRWRLFYLPRNASSTRSAHVSEHR